LKRKITVTTGTRADYGLLRQILHLINSNKNLELYLLVTGMHLSKKHGYTIHEIKNDGFKIYKKFSMIAKNDDLFNVAFELGSAISKFSKIFNKIQPDINLILGDRDEMLASALAASHMNIPNAHIHGGDKTKAGIDENNRHAITKLSNIHFVATNTSKTRVIKMGENPKYVFLTGSPNIDEIKQNNISKKIELEKKYQINLNDDTLLLIFHPVTTQIDLISKQIKNILESVVELHKTTIAIVPNSDVGNKIIFNELTRYSKIHPFIHLYKNVPRNDFLGLLKNSKILLGNSSAGMIEASCFPIKVINLGIRQEGREHGENIIHIKNFEKKSIKESMIKILKTKKNGKLKLNSIYGDGTSSKKIISYLEKIKIDDQLISKQIHY
jgi:GDP/UDP-N,N'-diacetylbacillosamine 2-epimerase (hydrolysing)